jgi:hypothetical protein
VDAGSRQENASKQSKPDRFEPAGTEPRPRAGAISGEQVRDSILMKSVRPDNTDPIPLRNSPHNMGTIMIRFVGLLVAIVVVLALLWSR